MKTLSVVAISLLSIQLLSATQAHASPESVSRMRTSDFLLGKASSGCQPKGMKSDGNTKMLWVAEMCGRRDPVTKARVGTAGIYDIGRRAEVKVLRTPDGAKKGIIGNTEVEFTLDGQFALIARAEGDGESTVAPRKGLVTVVNARTLNIAKYIPVGGDGSKIIARRPMVSGDRSEIIYVANYFSDDISVLNVADLRENGDLDGQQHFVKKVKLSSKFPPQGKSYYKIAPRGVAFTSDGRYAVILATETGSMIVMDAVNHKQIAELAPISASTVGREVNVRHIVTTNDGNFAYLSHMRGNAISRIDMRKFISLAVDAARSGRPVMDTSTWDKIFVPFANGQKLIVLEDYPADHPNFPNGKWDLAHPNTIVLDPVNNKYLYVSHRTTSNRDYNIIDLKIKGKVDVIDLEKGKVAFTLVGGAQPTALEVTPDNKTLMSAGFKDQTIYFFDIERLINEYED